MSEKECSIPVSIIALEVFENHIKDPNGTAYTKYELDARIRKCLRLWAWSLIPRCRVEDNCSRVLLAISYIFLSVGSWLHRLYSVHT